MEQIRTNDDQMQVNVPVGQIGPRDALTQILRQGAQRMLTMAIETEVEEYLSQHCEQLDQDGHRQVVRNGYLPQRKIQTGIGQVAVRQPRINDQRLDQNGQRRRFRIMQHFFCKFFFLLNWLIRFRSPFQRSCPNISCRRSSPR